MNKKSKKPQIKLDGKPVRMVPQCAGCGCILEDCYPSQHGWKYIELTPYEGWGWLCPNCQTQIISSSAEIRE